MMPAGFMIGPMGRYITDDQDSRFRRLPRGLVQRLGRGAWGWTVKGAGPVARGVTDSMASAMDMARREVASR